MQAALEYALIYAAAHGRREVVELLLSKSPDLDVKEPVYGGSAIGMAGYPHGSAGRPNGSPEESWSCSGRRGDSREHERRRRETYRFLDVFQ